MPFVKTDLGRWYFEERAASRSPRDPAIVLLHALFCDSRAWAPCIAPLAALGRVLAFDAPGHGRSEAAPPFTLADNALALDRAVDSLGVERAIFVGLFIAFMRRFGLPLWLVNAVLAPLLSAHPTPDFCAELVRPGGRCLRDGLVRSALAVVIRRQSLVERLGEITVPTLLVFGREDHSVTSEAIRHLREGIRGSETVLVEGAGHLAAIDSPAEVSGHLVSFAGGLLAQRQRGAHA